MAYPAQYVDPAKPEVTGTNLENTVQQNHVVAEGKYLCARCGSPYVTHECRTCRRIYCTSCSDFLHAYGDYAKHKVRPFDPNYEAYKRVGKRGTKFDTNAPSPQLLAPGEKLSEMPRDSVLALVLLIIAFILCVISVATPGWTVCNHVDPSMKIGQWTTVMYGKAEGTLYFPIPLPCPEKFFKIPVRVSRAFMLGALFFTFQGMVLTLLAQKACWRSLVMLKAAAVSGFVAAVCYIVAISLWIHATLHDADCGRGTFDSINPYGARASQNGLVIGGHCYFSYGWYLAWICLLIVLLTGFMLFDWLRGLPILAMISLIAIFIAQLFSIIAFILPRWTKGSATYAGQKMDTWSGLWRECVKNPSPDSTFEKLNYFCGSLASWKSGNTPLVRSDCATKKGSYHAVRALVIVGLSFSVVAGALIFYAHALRKPLATKISGALCGVTFITFLIAIIIYGAMQNSSHGSCPKLPICDTNSCSLGAGWILQLVATILALIATVLLCIMRVGFEREQLTTEDHTRYERPAELKQQPDVWVEQQPVYDYNAAPEYTYTENREAAYAVDENYNYNYADPNYGENYAEQYYYTS